ncbi:hypothetical protein Misp01_02040 [Microtetraspora sp. NBRC 13810]|nr:hypothetical protein Misp01_02040 [Microtetraspora sp. NBRC 13810]
MAVYDCLSSCEVPVAGWVTRANREARPGGALLGRRSGVAEPRVHLSPGPGGHNAYDHTGELPPGMVRLMGEAVIWFGALRTHADPFVVSVCSLRYANGDRTDKVTPHEWRPAVVR